MVCVRGVESGRSGNKVFGVGSLGKCAPESAALFCSAHELRARA